MRRIEGSIGVKLIECTHPKKNKWRIRWDVQEVEDDSANYMETEFDHKPTEEEIRQTYTNWVNAAVEETILSGFEWNGMPVWLSNENKFNYKAAYDMAVMSDGATLPVKFKFGTDEEPMYHTFTNLEEFTNFFTQAMQHIQNALNKGWTLKDTFNIAQYR